MQAALEELLKNHAGTPQTAPYTDGSMRLHKTQNCADDCSVLHGCYWVDAKRVSTAIRESLSPMPIVSSMAPKSAAKRLQLTIPHPRTPDIVGVPKFFGLSAFGPPSQDKRSDGLPMTTTWNQDVTLRPEQHQGLAQTIARLEEWGGAFFVADCGFGKSVVIARLVHEVKRRAMIVVPRLTLVQQMLEDFGANASSRRPLLVNCSVGVLQGSWQKCEASLQTADIVIASLDSLAQFKYPQSFWETFGLIVFDEAHHMAARTLSAILPHVPTRRIVGFSATPNRKDGLEPVLFWLLGPTSFVYQRLPSVTGQSNTVHVKRIHGESIADVFRWGGKLAFAEMLNSIAQNEARNAKLVRIANELLQTRAKVLLITAFRDHCDVLADALRASHAVTVLHGGVKRKRDEESARCMIATYGLLEEGFDDPDLDTVVLCTPRSTVQQTVGRIERTKQGKAQPLVVDIVDSNAIFFAMWNKRKKFYKSRGFAIEESQPPSETSCEQLLNASDLGFVLEETSSEED